MVNLKMTTDKSRIFSYMDRSVFLLPVMGFLTRPVYKTRLWLRL